jgi:hypothetical protein
MIALLGYFIKGAAVRLLLIVSTDTVPLQSIFIAQTYRSSLRCLAEPLTCPHFVGCELVQGSSLLAFRQGRLKRREMEEEWSCMMESLCGLIWRFGRVVKAKDLNDKPRNLASRNLESNNPLMSHRAGSNPAGVDSTFAVQ